MPAENAESIVLNSVPFSNTSQITTLYTREFGKFSALAKGSRREKNPFDNGLDVMARLKTTHYPRNQGLQLLTQASLERWFRVDRNNIPALFAGYYVVELVDSFTAELDPSAELFDLTDSTLAALTAGEEVWRTLLRFNWRQFEIIGIAPRWDGCVVCGKKRVRQPGWLFGLIDGGVICPQCAANQSRESQTGEGFLHALPVSPAVLDIARQFADSRHKLWQRLKAADVHRRELRKFTDLYIAHNLGWAPKMQRYSRMFI